MSLDKQPLGEWLNNKNFSKQFQENYILPMSAAIWSMNFNDVLNYPISNLFSFFKLLDLKGFKDSFAQYDPLAKKSRLYGQIYPFIETLLGILFLLQKALLFSLLTTVLIFLITSYGVIKSLINGNNITCACLGTTLKLPMTEATLIENILMITMAFVGLVGFWL